MATVIREQLDSRSTNVQAGQKTAARRFVVYDDVTKTNFSRPDQVEAVFGTGVFPADLPNFGSEFPNISALKAMEPSIKLLDGQAFLWEVTWNYLRTNFAVGAAQPYEVGYREFNYEATGQFVDAWRKINPLALQGASPSGDVFTTTFQDIGGTSIDAGGDPTSVLLIQQIFSVLEVVEGSTLGGTFAAYIGKRNAQAYLGAAPGRLVYAGIQSNTRVSTGIFARTHRIVWDQWFHMRQQPLRDENKEVYCDAVEQAQLGVPKYHAARVRWVQPYTDTMNFGIFGSP